MKDINIIEVPVSKVDNLTKFSFEYKKLKYYLAYENDITEPMSVLFEDLNWIRKSFGVDHTIDSIITTESLNEGRENEISNIKRALKANCPLWELDKVDKNGNVKIGSNGEVMHVYKLSENGKKIFEENINRGKIVLCCLING